MSTEILSSATTEQFVVVDVLLEDNMELKQMFEYATTQELSAIQLSPDGRYLATSNIWGKTSIRDTSKNGRRILVLNSGQATRISALAWLPVAGDTRSLFIASCNGYINCVTYADSDSSDFKESFNTSVWVPGFVTSMTVNPGGTHLAVAHDYTVRAFSLPFPGGDPKSRDQKHNRGDQGRLVFMGTFEGGRIPHLAPVREQKWPLKVEWLSETVVCVAFFSCIKAFDIKDSDYIQDLWTLQAPTSTEIGSFAISPSKQLIAATNLKGGVEWFNLKSRLRVSTTIVQNSDEMETRYILPIAFLGETTFVCGHDDGTLVLGGHGVDAVHTIGQPNHYPSQLVSVVNVSGQYKFAFASTFATSSAIIRLSIEERETETAPPPPQQPPSPSISNFSLGPNPSAQVGNPNDSNESPDPNSKVVKSQHVESLITLIFQTLWEQTVFWVAGSWLWSFFKVVFQLLATAIAVSTVWSFVFLHREAIRQRSIDSFTALVDSPLVNSIITSFHDLIPAIQDPVAPSSRFTPQLASSTDLVPVLASRNLAVPEPSVVTNADIDDVKGIDMLREEMAEESDDDDGSHEKGMLHVEDMVNEAMMDEEAMEEDMVNEAMMDEEAMEEEEMMEDVFLPDEDWVLESFTKTQVKTVTKTVTSTVTATVTATVTVTVTSTVTYAPRRTRRPVTKRDASPA